MKPSGPRALLAPLRGVSAHRAAVLVGAGLLGAALSSCGTPPAKSLPPPEYETPDLPPFGAADAASNPHLAPGSGEDSQEQGLGGAPAFTGAP